VSRRRRPQNPARAVCASLTTMRQVIFKVIGFLLVVCGLAMLPPAFVALIYDDGQLYRFLAMGLSAIAAGALLIAITRAPKENVLRTRGGFMIVTVAWIVLSLVGAVPFMLINDMDFASAVFEAASGFTTTGSTAIVGLDKLPKSLLFFRQEIQWLGGIGVVVAAIALLPMLGIGGMQLMRAETTGPAKSDKLRPRVMHTAQALWRLYVLLTVGCAIAYWLAGMPLFDSIAHSLSTVSTGGFAIYDASFAHYDSPAIEAVAIVFMLLGAVNFAVHFRAYTALSLQPYAVNPEVRSFFGTVLALTLFIAVVLVADGEYAPLRALRYSAFEVATVITSTGYGVVDFSVWPSLLPVLLIFVSFIGGCAGSTAGGLKVIRLMIMLRQAVIEVTRLIHPRMVQPLRIGKDVVDDGVVRAVWAFFTVYTFVFVILMLTVIFFGLDQVSAFSAIATCINNLGPGLGVVTSNFASVSDPVKFVCAFACILGRLEVLTIFVLFTPSYWRA
jgi:trk system potassium uptake protein TrkH